MRNVPVVALHSLAAAPPNYAIAAPLVQDCCMRNVPVVALHSLAATPPVQPLGSRPCLPQLEQREAVASNAMAQAGACRACTRARTHT